MEEDIPSASGQDIGIADDLDQGPSPLTPEGSISDEKSNNNSSNKSNAPPPFIRPPIDNRANRPQRSISDEKANNNSSNKSNAPPPFIRPPIDNRANRPQRKNGLFLSGQETTSVSFN
uniref:Uncharacterized protein n=1 Tax=Panagrolaimus sp. PS1159 TaxID=55785 RepID=A0AC35GED3_9BILA